MRSIEIISLVTVGVLLSACSGKDLTRAKAMDLLKDHYPDGTATKVMYLCDQDAWRVIHGTKWGHVENAPCGFDYEKRKVFQEAGIVMFDTLKIPNGQRFATRVTSTALDSGFVRYDEETRRIEVDLYDYKIAEITGIRIVDRETADVDMWGGRKPRDCDALVEYRYERWNLSPWAEAYIKQKKFPDIWEACFQKYDDGWRLVDDSSD